jgi:hypothetical protein
MEKISYAPSMARVNSMTTSHSEGKGLADEEAPTPDFSSQSNVHKTGEHTRLAGLERGHKSPQLRASENLTHLHQVSRIKRS